MSFEPLVSVVIPTYNRTQQTIAAIEGVLAQTYRSVEVIVIDDGSTDGSGDAIQNFASKVDKGSKSIRYFHQINQGPSIARNQGIAKAQGEYIAFLDSDDVWLPEKLERQVEAMDRFKDTCEACLTDSLLVTDSGEDKTTFDSYGRHYEETMGIVSDALVSVARAFCGFWISTLLVRASVLKRFPGFDPNIQFCEDRDFVFNVSLLTPVAYVNIPLVRADRRSSAHVPACRPWATAEIRLRGQQRMLEKWLKMDTRMPADVRRAIGQSLRGVHSSWGNWHLEMGDYGAARRAIANAMQYEVSPGLTAKWALAWLAPGVARKLAPKSQPYL